MALAYPFVGAMTGSAPSAAVTGPLTLLPKPFASDIDMKDKDFGTREETLEEEEAVFFGFGKNKGNDGVDREGTDDDDDDEEEEDEKVLIVAVVVEEPARVDELNH